MTEGGGEIQNPLISTFCQREKGFCFPPFRAGKERLALPLPSIGVRAERSSSGVGERDEGAFVFVEAAGLPEITGSQVLDRSAFPLPGHLPLENR